MPRRDAVRKKFIANRTDVKQSKRTEAEAALLESEHRYRTMIEQSADGIYIFDAETGRIVHANQAFARLLGYAEEEVLQLTVYDTLVEERASVDARIDRLVRARGTVSGERLYRKRNGERMPVRVSVTTIKYNGRDALCIMMHDITERKRNEAHLHELLESLKRKNEEIELTMKRMEQMQSSLVQSEKMASIGQLTAGIAHEINNPLAFVSSNLNRFDEYYRDIRALLQAWREFGRELGADPGLRERIDRLFEAERQTELEFIDGDFAMLMEHTREGSNRIKAIVDQLRGFSHLAADDLLLTDLNQALEETLLIVRNEIKYKATVEKSYGAIPPVLCNSGEMKQVFVNLLVNAAHAIREKGVITLRSELSGSNVRIMISDTGAGIAAEHLKKIFNPFFTTKPVGKGTGLGLWIVSTILEKHHGSIAVESMPEKGTTFTLTLPHGHQVEKSTP
jgi:PAS domain S-box-containing protein